MSSSVHTLEQLGNSSLSSHSHVLLLLCHSLRADQPAFCVHLMVLIFIPDAGVYLLKLDDANPYAEFSSLACVPDL